MPPVIRAALFDFGGVILSSPVRGVRRATSSEHGLPDGLPPRSVNATDPDTNAWARLERSEVDLDEFAELFDAEADARSATRSTAATSWRCCPARSARRWSRRCAAAPSGSSPGCSPTTSSPPTVGACRQVQLAEVLSLFDAIIESSKVGVRKPDPRFYEMACDAARHRADRGGLPRRPRRQPQAGPRSGHDHHQGHRPRRRHRRARTRRRLPPLADPHPANLSPSVDAPTSTGDRFASSQACCAGSGAASRPAAARSSGWCQTSNSVISHDREPGVARAACDGPASSAAVAEARVVQVALSTSTISVIARSTKSTRPAQSHRLRRST